MSGQRFKNFDQFRETFWKTVADDPNLSQAFGKTNIARMKDGLAPYVAPSQTLGKRRVYELDHNYPISQGGPVYDLSNIIVRTPRNHVYGK